jgi:hypothetical protein
MKAIGMERVMELLRTGQAEYAYHILSAIKVTKELNLFATPEESKAFGENMAKAIEAFLNAVKVPAQTMPQGSDAAPKQGRSVDEIITEFQKSAPRFVESPFRKSQDQQQQQEQQQQQQEKQTG